MNVEDQIRNFASKLEANQSPITVDEIWSADRAADFGAVVDDGVERSRRGWMAAAAALVLVVSGVGVWWLVGGEDSSRIEPVDSPTTSTTQVIETISGGAAVIGETITFDDGGKARVNTVMLDAPQRSDLYSLPGPGFTSTEVEIERCSGTDSTPVDPPVGGGAIGPGFNRSNWIGIFDDGTEADALPGYWLEIAVTAGGCSRGWIAFKTPDNTALVEVELTVWGSPDEVHRWDLRRFRTVEAPLRPTTPPDAVLLGEPMNLRLYDGLTATVLNVTDDVPPSPDPLDPPVRAPGTTLGADRKLAEIEVELCDSNGGTFIPEPQFVIATTDNYIGNAGGEALNGWDPFDAPNLVSGNFPAFVGSLRVDGEPLMGIMLAPGECVTGTIQIDLPQDSNPAYVIVTDVFYEELGRTRVDEEASPTT